MALANKFGAGYLQPVTGGELTAAFMRAVRVPGSSLAELKASMVEDNIQDDESGGLHRRGRLIRSPSGRWIRSGRMESG